MILQFLSHLSHFPISIKIYSKKISNNFYFLPTLFQRSRKLARFTKFPLLSNIEGWHSNRLNDSKSRRRFISKLRRIDPHVPHTRKRWIVVHVQKKHACIIAKRFWHVESNRFLHVPTFPNQTEPERARELSFLLCSKEGRNFFSLLPFRGSTWTNHGCN